MIAGQIRPEIENNLFLKVVLEVEMSSEKNILK